MDAQTSTANTTPLSNTLYQYQPIEPKSEIRILTICPSASSDLGALHGELSSAKLPENPKYEALSYRWGENAFPETLHLPAANLRHAEQPRHLWVDAVCINQADLLERSEQVQRMVNIYKKAQRTLVWLGEWLDDGELSDVTPASLQDFLQSVLELSRADKLSYENVIQRHNFLGCYLKAGELLERSWFTRVWVLQEAAVAREVTFFCGQATFSWDMLIEGFHSIGNMKNPPYFVPVMRRWYDIVVKAVTFCRRYIQEEEYWKLFSCAPLPDRLLTLLLLSNGQAATDQRDSLYAIVSLASLSGELQQETILDVDYQKSVEEVLSNLALYLLKSTRDLSIFYSAGYQVAVDVPSWVPTWQGNRNWDIARYFDPRSPLIRLPHDEMAEIFFSCDEKSIVIKGHLIGHITKVGRPAETGQPREEIQTAKYLFGDWQRDILQPLDKEFPFACSRALVGDRVDQLGIPDKSPTAKGVWLQTLFHSKGWDEDYDHGQSNREQLLYCDLMDQEERDEGDLRLQLFCSIEVRRLKGGAPFATSSGLFGFSPNALLLTEYPAASLCLFQGCRVPIILAGGPEEYEVLGPCYLQPYITLKTTFGYPDLVKLV